MKLYYHKTSGGAEYLTDSFVLCENGHKEGTIEGAQYVVRIDGYIEKDAELLVTSNNSLLKACEKALATIEKVGDGKTGGVYKMVEAAIKQAKGENGK